MIDTLWTAFTWVTGPIGEAVVAFSAWLWGLLFQAVHMIFDPALIANLIIGLLGQLFSFIESVLPAEQASIVNGLNTFMASPAVAAFGRVGLYLVDQLIPVSLVASVVNLYFVWWVTYFAIKFGVGFWHLVTGNNN